MLQSLVNEVEPSQTDHVIQPTWRGRDDRSTNHPASHSNDYRGDLKSLFSHAAFAKQFARQPLSTGAIAPSSKRLARHVAQLAYLEKAETVVELGPGTGVFTEQITHLLSDKSLFFAIELNKNFVHATNRRCPHVSVYHDEAASLPVYLQQNNRTYADRVICSLPWTIFDEYEQDNVLTTITDSLKPGGVFISIIYWGARFRARGRYFINSLPNHFSSVLSTPIVWQNLPPTQIYCCIK